jgi:hypothetical protein
MNGFFTSVDNSDSESRFHSSDISTQMAAVTLPSLSVEHEGIEFRLLVPIYRMGESDKLSSVMMGTDKGLRDVTGSKGNLQPSTTSWAPSPGSYKPSRKKT